MKPKLTKQAKELLVKACVSMLEHPHQYDQAISAVPIINACGTSGCIYGFIAMNEKRFRFSDGTVNEDSIAKELGFRSVHSHGEPFYVLSSWPIEYRNLFRIAETPLEQALVAVSRIRHFIKTGL